MNGNIFCELSLSDLDEKNYLGGLEKRTKQKTEQTRHNKSIIIKRVAFGTTTKMNLAAG